MKKMISTIVLVVMLLSVVPVFAAGGATTSITLSRSAAKVGDTIEAIITLENMTPGIITLPVHFNSDVIKIVNNSGSIVRSGLKTAAEARNGNAGIIPGQAISGDLNADGDPLYWNGAIFENPQYPYLDNENGLYKLMFTNTEAKEIKNETLITLRFVVVGAGNTDIRFATKSDSIYDKSAPAGAVYFGNGDDPTILEIKTQTLTATESDTTVTPPPASNPNTGTTGGGGGGIPSTVTVNPETTSGALAYEVPEKLIDNSLARAADESGNSLNITVNADASIKNFVIKIPVPSIRKAEAVSVFNFVFDTPIGVIGFNNAHVLAQTNDNSEFVILTLKNNLDCSIAIDDKTIRGCILGFHTDNMAAVAFSQNPIMKSRFDGKNLIFNADENGSYSLQVKEMGFADLSNTHWSYGYIQSLMAKTVLNGMGDNRFEPESNVTREQFAKMIVGALEIYDANAVCDFTDLPAEHWAYSYVASAVKAGIIKGYDDGAFGVGKNITRQEMAVMVSRSDFSFPITVTPAQFTDSADIGDWAKSAVSKMQMANIISGMPEGNFAPQENATRAQAARIIFGVLGMI